MKLYVALALLVIQCCAKNLLTLDGMTEGPGSTVGRLLDASTPVFPYTWDSPYYTPSVKYPERSDILGGQRDLIIGEISGDNGIAAITFSDTEQTLSTSLPIGYRGSAYFQYDGIDNTGTSDPFPGSILNSSPGIGTGALGAAVGNGDGTIDFTRGSTAVGIAIEVKSDYAIYYTAVALDNGGNTATFTIDAAEITDTFAVYTMPFDGFTIITFDWTHVAAFQIRVSTFHPSDLTYGDPVTSLMDTVAKNFLIFGYEISGFVGRDCGCGAGVLTPYENEEITLTGLLFSDSTTSDANGAYSFGTNIPSGDYVICWNRLNTELCGTPVETLPGSGCFDITLSGVVDLVVNFYSVENIFSIPPDVTTGCDATDTGSTGMATVDSCTPGATVTFSDVIVQIDPCTDRMTRTWTDEQTGESRDQVITIVDNDPPSLDTLAMNVIEECNKDGSNQVNYQAWLDSHGGAAASDLCTLTTNLLWSHNGPAVFGGEGTCMDTTTVTFTVTDECAFASVTMADFAVSDNVDPIFTTSPASVTQDCAGASVIYASYLSTNAGAVGADDCTSASITHDSPAFPGDCAHVDVTFTVSDSCARSSIETARFTVVDNDAPSFDVLPQDKTVECNHALHSNEFNTWKSNNAGATISDNCDATPTLSNNNPTLANGLCGDPAATTEMIVTASDACGNSNAVSVFFTIDDSTNPTFSIPPTSVTHECGPNTASQFSAWLSAPTADDSCSPTAPITNDNSGPPPADCNAGGSTTVTFTATDGCGNTDVATATFTLEDNGPPTFTTFPSSEVEECDSSVPSGFGDWVRNHAGAVATDSCGVVTLSNNNPAAPTTNCNGVSTMIVILEDECGNTATASATFTLEDNGNPTMNPAPTNTVVECADSASNVAAYNAWITAPQVEDTCDTAPILTNDDTGVPVTCNGVSTVTYTATDACGNSAVATASFTFMDNAAPVFNPAPVDFTQDCAAPSDYNTWLSTPQASDLCSGITLTNDSPGAPTTNCHTITVTFSASDDCGNTATEAATFTVQDNSAPVFDSPPSNLIVECDPSSNNNDFLTWRDNFASAAASDNCGTEVVTRDNPSFPTGTCGDVLAQSIITITATDNCGNSVSNTAMFLIVDTTAPVFSPPPSDGSAECNISAQGAFDSWLISNGGASSSDSCSSAIITHDSSPGSLPNGCVSSTTVTFTATDDCGNFNAESRTFEISDNTAPNISPFSSDSTIECNQNTNAASFQAYLDQFGGASATDDCTSVSWSDNNPSVSSTCLSSANVVFTATDACGFSSTTSSVFTIQDTMAPVVDVGASNLFVGCHYSDKETQINNWLAAKGGASASDCTAMTWSNDYSSSFCPSSTTVEFTVCDSCNGGQCSTTSAILLQIQTVFQPGPLTKWSIYFPACIVWDTSLVHGNTGSLEVLFGDNFQYSREIASGVDLTVGEYEWTVFGVLLGGAKVLITYDINGHTEETAVFEIRSSSERHYNYC